MMQKYKYETVFTIIYLVSNYQAALIHFPFGNSDVVKLHSAEVYYLCFKYDNVWKYV